MIPVPERDDLQKFVLDSLDAVTRYLVDILEPDSLDAISAARASVISSKKKYDKNRNRTDNPHLKKQPWGFKITFDSPLRFKEATDNNQDYVMDIVCDFKWAENYLPVNQDLVIRAWNYSLSHRERWDAHTLFEDISNSEQPGRVMWRCHFDLANEGQAGPKYHLQFGGNARDNEYCWIPEALKLPRIEFSPLDIVLACQMIVANFFPNNFAILREDTEWIATVADIQKKLLYDYYSQCLASIDNEQILLDDLWN